MQELTKQQREDLRRQAHDLEPVVQIGKQGLIETVRATVDQALAARELIKVKFGGSKEEKHEIAEALVESTGCALVAVIGNVAILYREHADPKKRKIKLDGAAVQKKAARREEEERH